MSTYNASWDGYEPDEMRYAKHEVSLQDTAEAITYEVGGKLVLAISVHEFERLCAELAKFDYIDWPTNE